MWKFSTRLIGAALVFVTLGGTLMLAAADEPPGAGVPRDTDKENIPPMPPEQAAAGFKAPPGFRVSVFAAEPAVRNPIAMAFDARGRLWVAENDTYAEREARFDLSLKDRLVIFDDVDGDGKQDKRTVFTDELQQLTSVELGRGGVWALCPPALFFIPDRNGDDVPDGPALTVLDGFTVPTENYHNFANGLHWGPDGWLYGRCGGAAPGEVGLPGTPAEQRIPLRGAFWRFQPEWKVFEVLCSGTTNPWGHDWTELGEPFFINTVNGHLWHAFAGAHFMRLHTVDPNPYVYETIDQHADHWHWDNSKDWSDSRNVTGEHDRRGGGHAHSGMSIYLGQNWPEEWHGKLLTLNLHGRRMNVERLEREGSGFVGKHEPDTLFAADANFRGIDLSYGPDGGVYVLDWSDTGECHESNGVQRSSGRVYKVTYGEPKRLAPFDLSKLSIDELVESSLRGTEWQSRMARRVLHDRLVQDARDGVEARRGVMVPLVGLMAKSADPVEALRAAWALQAAGYNDFSPMLDHPHESVRAWGVRLLTDAAPLDTLMSQRPVMTEPKLLVTVDRLTEMAQTDASGLVRLALASTLQRLPLKDRPKLAAALASRNEDAADHNLPLLVWYGLIPVAESDPNALVPIALEASWPKLQGLLSRRLAERLATDPKALDALVAGLEGRSVLVLKAVLGGLSEGLKGLRKAPAPSGWSELAARLEKGVDADVKARARDLSVVFGDGRALEELRALALDEKADLGARRSALEALIEARPPDLRALCDRLLGARHLNGTATKGLALFDDPAIGERLVASYGGISFTERGAVLDAMVQRVAFARPLVEGIAKGRVPKGDLTAFQARQIASLGDEALTARLGEVWGAVRSTAAERRQEIEALKGKLSPAVLSQADLSNGRLVFSQTCASCHKLYGEGRTVGPDLTGAGRDNLDYLLDNVLDPGATVSADFRMTVVEMKDGRVLNGIVKTRTPQALTLMTKDADMVLPRNEIEVEEASGQSMMPDGLLQPLSEQQVRDLMGYLKQRVQVPLPAAVR